MNIRQNIVASLAAISMMGATPALADKGYNGHDNGRHEARGHKKARERHGKQPPRRASHYKTGDRFSRGSHEHLRHPARHGLEQRRDWEYYRDGGQVYRVDSQTQRILAVINLLNAF
ncbi:hypothetical protein [Paracoccus sp. JM45]|uniref:hypothetical protein n=1 Tax=Paracoccus sp. JM45 TaxID=2283626 RepID=UPI000E6C54B0|nr:hypothetical protein [Paracoccus sp. JM45]RJE81117.1 hypothetical protein DWB67_00125 [Paracoccus sp. JM45]